MNLTTQQTAALRIAYRIRLNIRLNWRAPAVEVVSGTRARAFDAIACRAWDDATAICADRARAYEMVRGALQLLD